MSSAKHPSHPPDCGEVLWKARPGRPRPSLPHPPGAASPSPAAAGGGGGTRLGGPDVLRAPRTASARRPPDVTLPGQRAWPAAAGGDRQRAPARTRRPSAALGPAQHVPAEKPGVPAPTEPAGKPRHGRRRTRAGLPGRAPGLTP